MQELMMKLGLDGLAATSAGIIMALILVLFIAKRRNRGNSPGKPAARAGLGAFFKRKSELDDDTRAELRETLVVSDFGPAVADHIIEQLGRKVPGSASSGELAAALRDVIAGQLSSAGTSPDMLPDSAILLLVGINGSGKTTTVAKVAQRYIKAQRGIILGAADTFRAAASEQLQTWGDRLGVRVVRQAAGADPAAVAFDTVKAAESGGETVIIDTAGRIHGDQGLMNELKKIVRVVGNAREGAPDAIWLTLDAAQGQTAVEQARQFSAAVPVSGIILNKMDGEGRAGYALSITDELKIPIVAVGTGEGIDDIEPFDPVRFANRTVYGDAELPD